MKDLSKHYIFSLCALACLSLAGCGNGSDEPAAEDSASMYGGEQFDESQLPADFPKNLIPGDYDSATFTTFGQVSTAAFENRDPIGETIEHYTGLLGEPSMNIDSGDGDRSAQWNTQPWAITVLGNDDESIVSVSKISQ